MPQLMTSSITVLIIPGTECIVVGLVMFIFNAQIAGLLSFLPHTFILHIS